LLSKPGKPAPGGRTNAGSAFLATLLLALAAVIAARRRRAAML
jgi:hypothetical protein